MWAHRLIRSAEDNGALGETQGGGRPYKRANDVAIRKQLSYAYSRITRTNLGCADFDATACFDRIVAALALLCARSYGMPKDACKLHGITIDRMRHHIKTAMGVSTAFFQSRENERLFGSGQGSAGSMPLWTTLSVILFKAIRRLCTHELAMTNPDGTVTSNRSTDTYVYDTTNVLGDQRWNIDGKEIEETELSKRLTEQAQAWADILHTSGGKLNLKKCLVYLIVYEWKNGEPKQVSKADMSTEIKIRNEPNAEPEIIDLKDPTEAHRTLGTHQSPSGDMTTQAMVLRKKGRTYTAKFSTLKKMSKYKVWTAYTSMLRPALEYPLSTTSLETTN